VASTTVILVLIGDQTLILNKIIIGSVKIGENPQHGYTKKFLIKRKKYQAKLSHENFKPKRNIYVH
jgi:hypothetical protein